MLNVCAYAGKELLRRCDPLAKQGRERNFRLRRHGEACAVLELLTGHFDDVGMGMAVDERRVIVDEVDSRGAVYVDELAT